MADEGSSRKRRNREFEEVPLGATLNDHVSNGERADQREAKTSQCDVFSERATQSLHIPHAAKNEQRAFTLRENPSSADTFMVSCFLPVKRQIPKNANTAQ